MLFACCLLVVVYFFFTYCVYLLLFYIFVNVFTFYLCIVVINSLFIVCSLASVYTHWNDEHISRRPGLTIRSRNAVSARITLQEKEHL